MKKKLFLLIILCLGAVLLLAACGQSTDTDSSDTSECVHEYTVTKREMPTCTENGFATFECSLCHHSTDMVIESTGHNFDTTFTWAEDNTHASVLLECKTDSSHVYNVSATISEEITDPTCQTIGKQKIIASVTWGEKEYTDIKEYNLGLGECQNTYTYTLNGESCMDGFDMETACSVCGKKSHASFDSHVLFDMARFNVCGGEAVVNICPCGENVLFTTPDACSGDAQLDEWTETAEDGTVYSYAHSFCARCEFEIIRKTSSTVEGCYSYYNRETQIIKGESVAIQFYEPKYEVVDFHELVYSYSGEKIDSCENGYTVKSSCKICGHSEEITQSTHALRFDFEKIELEKYGACGGYLLIKKCPCEQSSDVSFSLFCDYDYSYEQKNVNGELHTQKTYTCKECNMVFVYDEYIKNASVFGIWRVTINGEIKYELELAY